MTLRTSWRRVGPSCLIPFLSMMPPLETARIPDSQPVRLHLWHVMPQVTKLFKDCLFLLLREIELALLVLYDCASDLLLFRKDFVFKSN